MVEIGSRFGKLTVQWYENSAAVGVLCDCGTEKIVAQGNLRSGKCKSCGCTRMGKPYVRHYLNTPQTKRTYESWVNMNERCRNPKHRCWDSYGGRGIRVCKIWQESFPAFLSDMGVCPDGFSIERIEVNGEYSKNNCKWIPLPNQKWNLRRSVFIEVGGERVNLEIACRKIGINPAHISTYKRRKQCTHQEAFEHYRKQKGF
jgi:hypothetical protein